jgi:hypothetical protein
VGCRCSHNLERRRCSHNLVNVARQARIAHVGKARLRYAAAAELCPLGPTGVVFDNPRGDLRAGVEPELAEDVGDVAVEGAFGDDEIRRDVLVSEASGDAPRDFELALCIEEVVAPIDRRGQRLLPCWRISRTA